jgi:hypothetical protein
MQYLFILCLAFDLITIKQEPNLERRSELALDNANVALDAARLAFNSGESDKMEAALAQVGESVDLSFQSLDEGVKNPRNNKVFKRAELRTRELLRRLEGMTASVGLEERTEVEKLRDRVADIHDRMLHSIMGKKK